MDNHGKLTLTGDSCILHQSNIAYGIWINGEMADIKHLAQCAAREYDIEALSSLMMTYVSLHNSRSTIISLNTDRSYRAGLRHLLQAWQGVDLLQPGRHAGPMYLKHLQHKGLKPASIGVRITAARQFYRALQWVGASDSNPFEALRLPQNPIQPWDRRQPYTRNEVHALLAEADSDEAVVVLLGAHAGLRASEMVNLKSRDLDLPGRRLLVSAGKGGRSRWIHASSSLLRALSIRDPNVEYVLPLWTYPTLLRRFHKLCDKVDIPRRGLHSLRHFAGTELMRELQDLEAVARHLGHSSLETTRVYAKWSDDRLIGAMEKW